jgi:Holliday junction DNA helicase RuvA
MLEYLNGTLIDYNLNSVLVEVNNIGYRIVVTALTLASLPEKGKQVKIYTYLHVKEDGLSLYGFANKNEKDLFELLISVSGIGPKMALAILSAIKPEEFTTAVSSENVAVLSGISGIGKKTAQRLILELKDKVQRMEGAETLLHDLPARPDKKVEEAISALISLGYHPNQVKTLFKDINEVQQYTVEELLKYGLKKLSSI